MADKNKDNQLTTSAHAPGKTCLTFSPDGATIYTGGYDALVRVWKTAAGADDEPDTAVDANEGVTCIAADSKSWLSGSEDSAVRRYGAKDTQVLNTVIKTTGVAVRYLALDPKKRRVAVVSDDVVVKLVDLDDTSKVVDLSGHTKPVRKASWHPSGSILTTSGSDGNIIVWDVSEDEPKQLKVIEGILPVDTSPESSIDHSILWHPSGNYFIVANRANEVITVSRSTWSQASSFSSDKYTGETTALALSANGVYLASACSSGIFVWATATRRVVLHEALQSGTSIEELSFSPTENLLAWTDSQGSLTRWRKLIPANMPDPVKALSSALSSANAPTAVRRGASPLFGTTDGDDAGGTGMDDGGLGIGDDAYENEVVDDDWIIDDLGNGMQDADHGGKGVREMVNVTKAQPAFQPGSTPFVNRRRYLALNNIGVVEAIDQDSHLTINVEFHDQTTRKSYHFTDHAKFDMAAIGERGIIYASPPEKGHPAQITYRPFATWTSRAHSEWTYNLPKDEKVVAVAAGGNPPLGPLRSHISTDGSTSTEGDGYVAIATNTGLIRFFSGGGMQRGPVWAVDGDVISMVGGRDYVFVVHREGGTSLDGNQNLKYTLRTVDTFRVMHTGRLPVNKGYTLKWVGISDEGAPVIYDSTERVMMLEHFRYTAQGSWTVLLDAKTLERRKGKEESYWPVGVSKSTFMCIILKGREMHPGFPRPLIQELDMRLPYLDMENQEAQKEERLARETVFLDHIRDTLEEDEAATEDVAKSELELDKEILQLIQLACKHDRLQRALDAAKLLHHTISFDMAAKVAEFYHLTGLSEKMKLLKEDRTDIDRQKDDRRRRKKWKSAAGVVRPTGDDIYEAESSSSRFQDTTMAPPITRPGLSPATILHDPSPFSRKPHHTAMSTSAYTETISADGKRKRENGYNLDDGGNAYSSKKRAVDENVMVPPADKPSQPKPNPFAPKPAENVTNNNNPFLRKMGPTKSMNKSESFFDKVNAAEDETDTNKNQRGKKSKSGPASNAKQTTLFGLPPGKKKEVRPKGQAEVASSQTTETQMESLESQTTLVADDTMSQMKDLADSAVPSAVDENSQAQTEMADDEPIDWPPSPTPSQGVLASA